MSHPVFKNDHESNHHQIYGSYDSNQKGKTNLIVMVRNVSIYQCMSSGYKEIDNHFHYALRGYCKSAINKIIMQIIMN